MLLSCLLLAFSVSIDSLGIGITYGLRKTKISLFSKIILFIISFIITSISIYLGKILSFLLPVYLTNFIGIFLLVLMGIFIIYQANFNNSSSTKKKKYKFFLKSLGITIEIIKNPISSDLNHSNSIDGKEAVYLGLALSVDSICVGIGGSILGINSFLFPFLVSIFQLIFLSFGNTVGKKISSIPNIKENIWNTLSGILLIAIGLSKFFIH